MKTKNQVVTALGLSEMVRADISTFGRGAEDLVWFAVSESYNGINIIIRREFLLRRAVIIR